MWVWATMVVQVERAGMGPLLAQGVQHAVHGLVRPYPDDPSELLLVKEEVTECFRHPVNRSEEYPHREHQREFAGRKPPELSDKPLPPLRILGHLPAS